MNEGKLIRFLIVALPTGLLFLGVAAMLKTHLSTPEIPIDPNEEARLDAAALNRKPVNRIDLERYLKTLTEQIGERHVGKPESLEKAAVWIESSLGGGNIGYPVERHVLDADGVEVRNLIAELPGKSRRDEIIIVGAHYDTIQSCPGANDNGTGVAAMMSLAQAMAGDQQERTIRFVAFVNEEPPYFQTDRMGSRVYAARCRSRSENIIAMLCLETIGYFSDEEGSQKVPEGLEGSFPKRGDFLAFIGDENSRYFADSASVAFETESGIPAIGGAFAPEAPGVGWSDHWSFWQEGYKAVMVTDTAPYRYPHYHKPSDTMDKLDLDQLVRVVKGLEAAVKTWANPE
ncbi:MAG: M28 family peptidase [Verrucomicrobiales bacterium]|nr:M28 family peptidase [Verrucomicrobiales bacterium]